MYDYITSECLSFWSAHLYGCCCLVVKSFPTPWTVAQQAPLSMGFSKKDYWSGLSFPSPAEWRWGGGCLPSPGIKLLLHWQVDSLPLRHQKSPTYMVHTCLLYSCNPQAPLFMVFPRKEYWSGLPCPPPGYLPDPGIKTATSVS